MIDVLKHHQYIYIHVNESYARAFCQRECRTKSVGSSAEGKQDSIKLE